MEAAPEFSDAQKREGISIKHDISVPVSRVAEFIARADAAMHAAFPGVRIVAFGHLGDGNIHYNVTQPVDARQGRVSSSARHDVNDVVFAVWWKKYGGSISAEHGIGVMKRDLLPSVKDPVGLRADAHPQAHARPQGHPQPRQGTVAGSPAGCATFGAVPGATRAGITATVS